jgi:hydrogenase maturation protease
VPGGPPVLLLAFGNPLRGDDGAAEEAVRGLVANEGLAAICAQQLLPEHSEAVAAAAGVVFIDARAGGTPGEVRVARIEPAAGGALGHQLGPAALLDLSRALFGSAPPAALVTVSGADFTHRQGLSPAVAAAMPRLREAVLEAAGGLG